MPTNSITNTHPMSSINPAYPSNQSTEQLTPVQLNEQITNLIRDGLKNNYSKEFVASEIMDLLEANPDAAGELKIKPDYKSVLHEMVEPFAVTIREQANKTVIGTLRKNSIINGTPTNFDIADNPNAVSETPWYELSSQSQVKQYNDLLLKECKQQGVDPEVAKAIMFMETTHGYYDGIIDPHNYINKSIRPMNVNVDYWKELGYSREALKNPATNIKVGVYLIKQITIRLKNPSIEKIATLYNSIGSTQVSNYGAYVADIYKNKSWLK